MRGRVWLCLAVLVLEAVPAGAGVFRDDFNGTAVDTAVWSIEESDGTVTLADGAILLSCPGGASFPVVTTRSDPFPPGDFLVRVRMKYVLQQNCGDGFGALDNFWELYQGQDVCRPFLLWEDSGGHYVYSGSGGHTWLGPSAGSDWHVYEWLYTGGRYEFWMDGVVRASGGCASRATKIFFGHPHPIHCNSGWTSFAIDFIEIESFGVTEMRASSWGALKEIHRD
jgi:hypothetical protein